MLQWICSPLLPREGSSAFWSWVNHDFTAADTASLCLSWISVFDLTVHLLWCRVPLWGILVGLKGQNTLKCSGSSLALAAASLGKGLGTQCAWLWMVGGSVLEVMAVSEGPNARGSCLALADTVKFPPLQSQCPPWAAEQGMAACAGFWRNLFLGFLFILMQIPSLLSNDNYLKIPFYFPHIPPVVEVSFLFIPELIWTPCVLLSLPGIWKGEITE